MQCKRRSQEEWMELIQICRNSGLSDRAWCIQEGISPNLVKSFLLTSIHDCFFEKFYEFIGGSVLVTGTFFMWLIHIRLPVHCIFPDTVYLDMRMNIS